jgi:hypothetical protein
VDLADVLGPLLHDLTTVTPTCHPELVAELQQVVDGLPEDPSEELLQQQMRPFFERLSKPSGTPTGVGVDQLLLTPALPPLPCVGSKTRRGQPTANQVWRELLLHVWQDRHTFQSIPGSSTRPDYIMVSNLALLLAIVDMKTLAMFPTPNTKGSVEKGGQ